MAELHALQLSSDVVEEFELWSDVSFIDSIDSIESTRLTPPASRRAPAQRRFARAGRRFSRRR
ncbi:hypothetical protein BE04_35875 [Sorangium cellulosum]|uniref:Uncharacterized protein n=2 Tax=Sorangium cellulosum TaxID=56 RepID=A0A150PGM9_SORCE|nr:hypothetical protein [Sorangium cellulosum]AGP39387.1 hypothetical protein SCE1572_35850 [Sorangium cellulosum So0157-2]KYF54820.1 hypothetical protein BE04_35875 [Sorangium cellulosum]